MDSINSWIQSKINYINELLKQSDGKTSNSSVYCNTRKGNRYFIRRENIRGREKKKYLGKSGSANVIDEKNEQMRRILQDALRSDKKLLEDFDERYVPLDIPSIEGMTSKCLHNIKSGFVIDRRMEKLFDWADEPYERNSAPFPEKVILTKDGTRARSKDECMLYDIFHDMNIPNRYDSVMEFDDPWDTGGTIRKSPDFVIPTLSGRTMLIEHAGLIMKPGYADNLKEKMQIYLYNGYVLGDNFFITSEDRSGGINEQALQRLAVEILDRVLYW